MRAARRAATRENRGARLPEPWLELAHTVRTRPLCRQPTNLLPAGLYL